MARRTHTRNPRRNRKELMHKLKLSVIVLGLLFLAGCGAATKTTTPGQPLDPQGNWLFTFTGTDGATSLQFAGQLFELTSPIVTSNEMASAPFGFTCGGMTANGQASGTNTINLTVTEKDLANQPTFALTGTIAADQEHMTGTYSSSGACTATGQGAGTWAAQELTPVTGTWTGTASNNDTLALALTENTDQTSVNMGQVTGTATIGGACFASQLNLTGTHLGESLTLQSAADANGAVLNVTATVDPAAGSISATFSISGGPCDSQTFTANLTPQ